MLQPYSVDEALEPGYLLLRGFPHAGTPALLNRVGVLTWTAIGALPEVVLILSPGFTAGAGIYRSIATEIVRQTSGRAAVWAVDRRPNLLDDRTGFIRAEAAGDPRFALDYYLGPRVHGGWKPVGQAEVPFMAEWGLDVALGDLRCVIARAHSLFPRAAIILGGHSLGGMLAQVYAASEFADGSVGHQDLSGIVLVDGAVRGASAAQELWDQGAESYRRVDAGERFWEDWSRAIAPQIGILAGCAALAGSLSGWRDQPSIIQSAAASLGGAPEQMISTLLSAAGGVVSNRAAFGLAVDDSTAPSEMAKAHVGKAVQSGSGIGWREGEAAGESGSLDAYGEVLRDGGDTDGLEWHSPIRLNADLDMVQNLDSGTVPVSLRTRAPAYVRRCSEIRLPVLAFVDTEHRGGVEGAEWFRYRIPDARVTVAIGQGYCHMDPLVVPAEKNFFLHALLPWLADLR